MSVYEITAQPLHLGLGATAIVQPVFTRSLDWCEQYVTRNTADVGGEATALFITAGVGTTHRAR